MPKKRPTEEEKRVWLRTNLDSLAASRFFQLFVLAAPEENDGRNKFEDVLSAVQVHRRRRNHGWESVPFVLKGAR